MRSRDFLLLFLVAVFSTGVLVTSSPGYAQDLEQQVQANRSLIESLYDQQQKEELNLYGYVSSEWRSKFNPSTSPSSSKTRNHFEAGRFALFADKQVSDRIRISGEIFFQNGATSADTTSAFSPEQNDGRIEASYYFIEYNSPKVGKFRVGKLWKPIGMQNEIGNNVPAITTIELPILYGKPGSLTYSLRTGAGIQYTVPSYLTENPWFDVGMKVQMDNGTDKNQYSADLNSKKTYSGRISFGMKNPSMLGLDSLEFSYSHDYDVSSGPPEGLTTNIRYTGVELAKGPVTVRAEHEDGFFAIRDFTSLVTNPSPPPLALPCSAISSVSCPYTEMGLDLSYVSLFYDATSNLTAYGRFENYQLGAPYAYSNYDAYTLGANYDLGAMTIKGEYYNQTYDGDLPFTGPLGTTYDKDSQVRFQAVVPF